MIAVSDIRDFFHCPRKLWLKSVAKIEIPNIGLSTGRSFHTLVHDITKLVFQAYKADLPGKIVDTEIKVAADELEGRIDVLRIKEAGGEKVYIIQDEKFRDPPKKEFGRVWPSDKIQIDAYTYLAEKCGYKPVESGIIIYNDLIPREVKPNPQIIPQLIGKVKKVLRRKTMPPLIFSLDDETMKKDNPVDKCKICYYYPLCQIIPKEGEINVERLKRLFIKKQEKTLRKQLIESIKMLGRV